MSSLKDPRVLFASERTLLAWNRTSVSLMAFGFVVERFGLFLEVIGKSGVTFLQREISFYLGVVFLVLSSLISFFSILQYRTVIASLQPAEIPPGYRLWGAAVVNGTVGGLALVLLVYLAYGFRA